MIGIAKLFPGVKQIIEERDRYKELLLQDHIKKCDTIQDSIKVLAGLNYYVTLNFDPAGLSGLSIVHTFEIENTPITDMIEVVCHQAKDPVKVLHDAVEYFNSYKNAVKPGFYRMIEWPTGAEI
jgi:hypothetical protein